MKTYAVVITATGEVDGHLFCSENEYASMVMPEGQHLVDDAELVAISMERSAIHRATRYICSEMCRPETV